MQINTKFEPGDVVEVTDRDRIDYGGLYTIDIIRPCGDEIHPHSRCYFKEDEDAWCYLEQLTLVRKAGEKG